jgi:butyrate kinase
VDKVYKILAINPGSTTTKVSLYENETEISTKNLAHSTEELSKYKTPIEQYGMRKQAILDFLEGLSVKPEEIDAVAVRGGPFGKYKSGAYIVGEAMAKDAQRPQELHHPSCISPMLAYEWITQYGAKGFNYDTVYVNEIQPVARISGVPLISRTCACHVLNSKAVARKIAAKLGKTYDKATFIVCHTGGGSSTSLHKNGKLIDAYDKDEGTFTPVRSGGVPCAALVELCFSGKYTENEVQKMLNGKGGLTAYLGTNDGEEVEERIAKGDEQAKLVYDAMAYQITKDIGALAAVAGGKVDSIILTGGSANSKYLTDIIIQNTKFIAPIEIIPGGIEMEALALGVLRVLKGEETAQEYIPGVTV